MYEIIKRLYYETISVQKVLKVSYNCLKLNRFIIQPLFHNTINYPISIKIVCARNQIR